MKLIDTKRALEVHLATGHSHEGVVFQNLDLKDHTEGLMSRDAEGAFFLGCQLDDAAVCHINSSGGILFSAIPDLPYHPYRTKLYSIDELMAGYEYGKHRSFYDSTVDSSIFSHSQSFGLHGGETPVTELLAQRLHDHSIEDSLARTLADRPDVVAIMGGHAMKRGSDSYRDVAETGRLLALEGYFLATGGGPGAMEAGNLGAWFAAYPNDALLDAIDHLATQVDYKGDGYLDLAFDVRDKFPDGRESLAIPTWHYGHEPTNLFATHIAKYFANSIREDGLLAIATAGVIYAPGSAGTVQEIFMDAAQNHYGTLKVISPMVFYDSDYWSKLNAPELLATLAGDRPYSNMIATVDDPESAVAFVKDHPPVPAD